MVCLQHISNRDFGDILKGESVVVICDWLAFFFAASLHDLEQLMRAIRCVGTRACWGWACVGAFPPILRPPSAAIAASRLAGVVLPGTDADADDVADADAPNCIWLDAYALLLQDSRN